MSARTLLTPEEKVVVTDFESNISNVFNPLFEDKWDEDLWNRSVADFKERHDPELVTKVFKIAGLKDWDAAKKFFQDGPPLFKRPGWVSLLIGQVVDLRCLEEEGAIEWIKGSPAGWKDAKVVVVEFWATWCGPCLGVFPHMSSLADKYGSKLKVIGINIEDFHAAMPQKDISAFVLARDDMNYVVGKDISKKAMETLFKPGGRLAIPTAIIVTTDDSVVRHLGNPSRPDFEVVLQELLL